MYLLDARMNRDTEIKIPLTPAEINEIPWSAHSKTQTGLECQTPAV